MLRRYGLRLATIAIAALALGSAFASATFGADSGEPDANAQLRNV